MPERTIIIGDIHGCINELHDLLEKLQPRKQDAVYLLGDLLNGGPDSGAVVRWARKYPLLGGCIMGNHERRLLAWHETGDNSLLKNDDKRTAAMLGDADWAWLKTLPLTIELPRYRTVLVHGGFLPNKPWQEQPGEVVTRIQVIDRGGYAAKRSEAPPDAPVWADLWQGPPYVVYGHTPRSEVYKSEWGIGLDTGCVYGGKLSAFVLPGRSIVQVRARKTYKSS